MKTGLLDSVGVEISSGDLVSLAGNITAESSMGYLPNGWCFDEEDVFEVFFDETIQHWSLKLGVEPDTAYNVKYMNHAVSLLHDGSVKIVQASNANP
jgi:catalase (peroxidase I)